MIKILYFGTNEHSANLLKTLTVEQGFVVAGVVTQPGRPIGRKQEILPSPVKSVALELGLTVYEPATLKNFSFPAHLNNQNIDVAIVYAYGIIIPQNILDFPESGTLNIHPSLLPKYRGPTPVQSALINGDKKTGVSIMLLDPEMDHGPILAQASTTIESDDTTASLTAKLLNKITPELIDLLPLWINKKISPQIQNHDEATYSKIFTRDDGKINFSDSYEKIYNLYRGLTPWPGVWTTWNDQRLKLLHIKKTNDQGNPGQVKFEKNKIIIHATKGSLEILELQLEGKKPMDAKTFINGYQPLNGQTLPTD